MRLSFNIRLRLLAFFLTFGGVLTLTSCSDDDIGYDVGNNEVKEVTVSLKISAGEVGDISVTRADYEDENALSGEYMNSLCVFVVDESNTIVAKLEPSSEDDTYDWEGKTSEWTSEEFTLSTGTYTVYAFSNWETVTSPTDETGWMSIINKNEGDFLEASDLNIDIDNPASKVNIEEGNYIPMSGSESITVTEDATIDVGMDRLVGRVEITIYGESGTDAEDVTLDTLTFGNWADNVPLMKNDNPTTTNSNNKVYTKIFDENTTLYAVNKDGGSTEDRDSTTLYFYVNETYLSENTGFDISLSTTRKGENSSYTATTQTTNIPRNYILPIYLSLSPYTLSLDIHAYAAAIDTEEFEYTNVTSDDNNNCIIQLLDVTTKFTMTPTIKDPTGEEVDEVTWTWEKTGNTETDNIEIDEDSDGTWTFTNLTATTNHVYTFSLTAEWTNSSGVTQTRTYNIQITLVNDRPVRNNAPAHSSWQGWYWNKEQLNMYRIH